MNKLQCQTISAFFVILAIIRSTHASPMYPQMPENMRPVVEVEDPEAVLEMLARIGQSILRAKHDGANSKRGLDLGLGRGFSGSQAAKHIMGLAAANFASGPGKRKRTEITLDYPGLDASSMAGNLPSDWYIKN